MLCEIFPWQGYAAAQYNLGFMYEQGEGVGKDEGEAARWIQKAAEAGNAHAMVRIRAIGTGTVSLSQYLIPKLQNTCFGRRGTWE